MNYVYSIAAIVSTFFAAISFVGIIVSLSTYDITSAVICGLVGAFSASMAALMVRLMEF